MLLLACLFLVGFNLLAALALMLAARSLLWGAPHEAFDTPAGELASAAAQPSAASAEVLRRLRAMQQEMRRGRRSLNLARMRAAVDDAFARLAPPADGPACEYRACFVEGLTAEWVLAPGVDPARRLLYLHGGAFVAGSPRSHRALTCALARRTACAVLALDYRLMPEHPRRAGLVDCQRAYRWLLAHGPQGREALQGFFLAGDSAGGSLALSLLAWARDAGLRAVDAAVVFSPSTDSTLASPSMRAHIGSDPFLGPTLGKLARLPRWLRAWLTLASMRLPPQHPLISPLHGHLADLPPLLVQASTSEMLLDDARRYVNKACRAGSPARLALWPAQIHVWQLFEAVSPEAREALDQAAAFLLAHEPHAGQHT